MSNWDAVWQVLVMTAGIAGIMVVMVFLVILIMELFL